MLVSNWHVFSGRSVYDLRPRHPSAATPVQAVVHMWEGFPLATVTINLVDDDERSLWWEHPEFGHKVDVGVIQFHGLSTAAEIYMASAIDIALPLTETNIRPNLHVTDRLSIVGFPEGFRGPLHTAVWTQATIASEPALDQGRVPRFLVDAKTRQGQSGSPVIMYGSVFSDYNDLHAGEQMAIGTMSHPISVPLGVYSGRATEDLELGFVWRYAVVEQIVNGAVHAQNF